MRPCIEMEYPEFSGCYALIRAGRVVYVGQSVSVLLRLSNHRNALRRFKAGKPEVACNRVIIEFSSVRIYPCSRAEMDDLEDELIMLYDPPLNTRKPKRKRYDIAALAARAGLDFEGWKRASDVYSPKQSTCYRRA